MTSTHEHLSEWTTPTVLNSIESSDSSTYKLVPGTLLLWYSCLHENEMNYPILTTTLTCLDRSLELLCRKSEKAAYTTGNKKKDISNYMVLQFFTSMLQLVPSYAKIYSELFFFLNPKWSKGNGYQNGKLSLFLKHNR